MLEVGGRVVAGAVFELDAGTVDFDGELAVLAVAREVGGVEADGVVGRGVGLDFGEGGREVVGVKEGRAAGVGGERGHDFLRGEVLVHVVHERAAVEAALPAQAAGGGVAQRADGLQAARVDAVDGEVGAHGGVDGGAERSFVLDAVARDAAGEVEQRLLLVDFCEGLGDGAQGEELAVGVEVVVLALVGRVAGGVFHLVGVGVGALGEALALGAVVGADFVDERVFVGGKVLIDAERVAERDQSDEVGGLHFCAQEGLRRIHGALQILGLHGGEVEEHHDQSVIAQFLGLGDDDGFVAVAGGAGGEAADGGFVERRGHVDAFEIEGVDGLLFAVFEDFEVALLEALDDFAGFGVAGDDVGEDQIGVGLEPEAALRRGGDLAGGLRGRGGTLGAPSASSASIAPPLRRSLSCIPSCV